eukprot:GCRY01004357.1.p1 GENE.GCRY01004357.1~~GCRY01004357.1.p1  ORF type:complete len:731 (-),score=169.61 GCRY01004357.1:391-2583(-)
MECPKSVKSTVALIPSLESWVSIQAIRKQHDKQYKRWLPHINLLYPFFEESVFSQLMSDNKTESLLKDTLRSIQPFTLSFNKFGFFKHGKSCTIWLEPEATPKSAINDLQAKLEKVFPVCSDLRQRGENGFTAHLSVAQCKGENEAKRLISQFEQSFFGVTMTIQSVFYLGRKDGESPFLPIREFFFNSFENKCIEIVLDKDAMVSEIMAIQSQDTGVRQSATQKKQCEGNSFGAKTKSSDPIATTGGEGESESLGSNNTQEKGQRKGSRSQPQPQKGTLKQRKPMRTAADVLSRVRWDNGFSEDEWLVGYLDRVTGVKEVTIAQWDEGLPNGLGAIPEHTVQYFKCRGEIVWDKRVRLDSVFHPLCSSPSPTPTPPSNTPPNPNPENAENPESEAAPPMAPPTDKEISGATAHLLQRKKIQISEENETDSQVFSVMQWNVLAEELENILVRSPAHALTWKNRGPAVLAEILRFCPSVVCLQEVQRECFEEYFKPVLEQHAYEGFFVPKDLSTAFTPEGKVDGVAIFVHWPEFDIEAVHPIRFKDITEGSVHQPHSALAVVLQTLTGQRLCICTFHLKAGDDYEHLRFDQFSALLRHVSSLTASLPQPLPIIYAGDLNTIPGSRTYNLALTSNLTSVFHTLYPLPSAAPYFPVLPFTNASHHLRLSCKKVVDKTLKTIDYMFCEPKSSHLKVVSLYEGVEEEMLPETLLPARCCPSDHLPLHATFSLKLL